METLSSCYFCGVAVDAAVEEYPLVRSEAFSELDTGQRIHLCPSCRRKLTTVIERVLEAAFDGSEPAVETLDPEKLRTVDAGEEMSATSVSSIDDESSEEVTAGIGTATESDTDTESTDESSTTETEAKPDTGSEEGAQTPDPTEWGTSADDDGGDEPVESTPGATSGEESRSTVSGGDADTADGDAAEVSSGTESGEEAATSGREDAAATASDESREYSKSEFNKIVRLLQNREFPVEIDELVVVSQSAYGIDERTCHAVIDALIDRGVVADQGEELVKS